MDDLLAECCRFWDAHARRDPLWAVLSDVGKEDRKWDVERFFETGFNEIALLFYQLDFNGIHVNRGSALDFGCGLGRLSQALAPHFNRVVGVDVSSKMVETAATFNRFPEKVSYVSNPAAHLHCFPEKSFDFIYSNLVLQHILPDQALAYVRELLRILAPAGVLVFQLPSHRRGPDEPVPQFHPRAMPDDAYRAELFVSGIPVDPLPPGTSFPLDLQLTNASTYDWSQPQFGAMRAGNHWLSGADLRLVVQDDGRAALPDILPSGATWRLSLTLTTPDREGTYTCEIDIAHEGVRWFKDRGSPVTRFPVTVRTNAPSTPSSTVPTRSVGAETVTTLYPWSRQAPGDAAAADPGDFPMYGVHTSVVLELLSATGGELIRRLDDYSCGDEWVSFMYFVRKPGVAVSE